MTNPLSQPIPPPPINWSRVFSVSTWTLLILTVLAFLSRSRTFIDMAGIMDAVVIIALVVVMTVAWVMKNRQTTSPSTSDAQPPKPPANQV